MSQKALFNNIILDEIAENLLGQNPALFNLRFLSKELEPIITPLIVKRLILEDIKCERHFAQMFLEDSQFCAEWVGKVHTLKMKSSFIRDFIKIGVHTLILQYCNIKIKQPSTAL